MNKEGLSNEAKLAVQSANEVRRLRRVYWLFKTLQFFGAVTIMALSFMVGCEYGLGKLADGRFLAICVICAAYLFCIVFLFGFRPERIRVELKERGYDVGW